MKRTLSILASGALLLALAGCTSSPAKAGATPSSSATPVTSATSMLVPVNAAQNKKEAHAAAESLRHIQAEPKKYFAAAAQKDILASGSKLSDAFPAGSKLEPDETGWNPLTNKQAAIDVVQVLADGTKVKYVAIMDKEGGIWKFLRTIKADDTAVTQ